MIQAEYTKGWDAGARVATDAANVKIADLQRQLQEAQRIVDAAVIWRDSTEDDDDADDALCIAVDAAIAGERTE